MGRINKTQIIKSRVRLDEMLTIKEASELMRDEVSGTSKESDQRCINLMNRIIFLASEDEKGLFFQTEHLRFDLNKEDASATKLPIWFYYDLYLKKKFGRNLKGATPKIFEYYEKSLLELVKKNVIVSRAGLPVDTIAELSYEAYKKFWVPFKYPSSSHAIKGEKTPSVEKIEDFFKQKNNALPSDKQIKVMTIQAIQRAIRPKEFCQNGINKKVKENNVNNSNKTNF